MGLHPQTRALMEFLRQNPALRARIAAPRDATLLYAGQLIMPAWKEIERWKQSNPQVASKKTLPEVLSAIRLAGQPFPDLHAWVTALEPLGPVDPAAPWKTNGFIGWRAVSGIFASNARGAVSFVIGSGITRQTKVFAATEIPVLLRNAHVDQLTRELVEYYQTCIRTGRSDIGVTFIAG